MGEFDENCSVIDACLGASVMEDDTMKRNVLAIIITVNPALLIVDDIFVCRLYVAVYRDFLLPSWALWPGILNRKE